MNTPFWHFNLIPQNWYTYSATTDEEPYVLRVLNIDASADKTQRETCRLRAKNPLELPIQVHVRIGGPYFPENPEQFMPKGMSEFASVPKQHFGVFFHSPRSAPTYDPEMLALDVALPEPLFNDIWVSLKANAVEMKKIHVNVCGASLTASQGFDEVSWQWSPAEHEQLLIADFGIRFGAKGVDTDGH